MDDTVLKLLEELEQVVDEGRSSPFSNKVQVDKDEIFEIIDEIKMKLPNEIKPVSYTHLHFAIYYTS